MATNRRTSDDPGRERQTRSEIIAAAKRLAQRHGLRKVTMEEIAAAVGKKKSFLYYYFPGRREVIQSVIETEFTEMQQSVRQAVAQKAGAVERLRTFIGTRLEIVLQRVSEYGPATVNAALHGAESGTDLASLVAMRQVFDREEARFLAGLIRQGIQEGSFAPLPNKLIDDIAYFLLSALRGVELEVALSKVTPATLEPRMSKVLEVFLRGLAA